MYRQGDVLIISVDSTPPKISEVPRDNGRVVLAYGEATGHAHAILSERATLFRPDDMPATGSDTYLKVVDGAVELVHEEHDTIRIPAGAYRIVHQREYRPGSFRVVED